MSAATNVSPIQGKPAPMEVLINGKVAARRRHESTWYTRIVTPAPDPYSRPNTVEVRSKAKLAEVGDETSITCRIGGYTRKPFKLTDRDTGEITTVTPVDITLEAIE